MGKLRNVPAVACMAILLLASCASESLGPEYREISEEESGLQFYAPGFAGGYRRIISGQDEQYVNRTVAIYGPRQGEFPHGQLLLIEMPPNRHFTRIDPAGDTIEDWEIFVNRQIVRGPGGTAFNAIGKADYAAFQADGVACIVFREPFGTVHDTGRGTRLLDGYYCKGPAPMMTAGEAEAVIRSAGHAEYGPAVQSHK